MKVTINNKETETQAKNVKELAQELDLPTTGCAVASVMKWYHVMNGKTISSRRVQTS